jgi:hypothetical protein
LIHNYSRTQNDVDNSILIIAQFPKELSEEEITILENGTLTPEIINRIEQNQKELKNLLNEMGYYNLGDTNKTWNDGDYFKENDLMRLFENAKKLCENFYVFSNTPKTPPAEFYWQNFNDLEKIAYDIEKMIDVIKSKYRQCGTFQCGEVNEL